LDAYLLLLNVPAEKWCAQLTCEPQLIGRSPQAAMRIPFQFQGVSRHHAHVWSDHRGHWLHDLGSKTGTKLNGVGLKVGQDYQLVAGDRIWLGGAVLEIVIAKGLRPTVCGDDDPLFDASIETLSSLPSISQSALDQLSHAELEVVLWIYRGFTDLAELGRKLHRSPNTVRTQLAKIFHKLNLHSREDLLGCLQPSIPEDGGRGIMVE
jgi:DNA-binding CsgD family transcriptional regulator